ncbi:TetR/AcrR family transcriptional regulator [Lutibacter aestuarii]|uniref:TetR/AcrR family transcriptional regulator n=1 Tax=Lutibacter aestuarii TaxID=861111 RepID=A0ABW2ZAS0_9FLAO
MNRSKKNIIIEKSIELFFAYGIQHITMDDIAEKCGISKKTIYKFFENKSDLLHHIIKSQVEKLKIFILENKAKRKHALEELIYFFNYISTISQTISPTFGKELKKFHSVNLIEVLKFKNAIVTPFVKENINRGIQEGLYKKDLNADEICDSFDSIAKIIFSDEFFSNSESNKNSITFLNSLFLYRLVSVKGLKELHKINTTINNNI